SDYFLSGPPLWLNGSEHFPGHTDKRVQREKAVTHHPPRVIYRNGNDQHVRNLFQNGSNATDVEWLDSPRPGPCAFRENKRRPILRSHISGQFKNFSDGLLRILAVYVGCSSVAKIERDAGNTTRQFDLGNKLSVMLTEEKNKGRNIIHALVVSHKENRPVHGQPLFVYELYCIA